jgi:hypothetical protein
VALFARFCSPSLAPNARASSHLRMLETFTELQVLRSRLLAAAALPVAANLEPQSLSVAASNCRAAT